MYFWWYSGQELYSQKLEKWEEWDLFSEVPEQSERYRKTKGIRIIYTVNSGWIDREEAPWHDSEEQSSEGEEREDPPNNEEDRAVTDQFSHFSVVNYISK